MNLRRRLAAVTLCLVSSANSAGGLSGSVGSDPSAGPRPATSASIQQNDATQSDKSAAMGEASAKAGAASVSCARDQVVCSSPMATGSKIASICASQSNAGTDPGFYYVFGRPGAPELRFPASDQAKNAVFNRTHLGFAGNNGGYAYSFVNADYKYIVYSVSGSESSCDGGVIVQPLDKSKSATKLACRSTAITETRDESLIDSTLHLKKDPQIQSSGLPQSA
jgi:hypothetical protein